MSVRGSKFLPEDSLSFAALDLICRGCGTDLDRWAVSTTHERFEDEQTWHTRGLPVVEEQAIPVAGGKPRFRYKFTCPRCPNKSRPLRAETIDAALHAIYEPGARAKVVEYPI